jgi:hypothetical protein
MDKDVIPDHEPISSSSKSTDVKKICGIPIKDLGTGLILLVIVPIIVSAIVSAWSFNYQFTNTMKNEQKNLANGYISDLEYVNRSISALNKTFNDPANPDYHKRTKIVTPLYPSWGLYYSNRQDIQKFDPELSSDMYEFYSWILQAEDNRVQYNSFDSQYPLESEIVTPELLQNRQEQKEKLFDSMIDNIKRCDDYLPALLTGIKNVRDS